jgi:YQGE family putative transporter
MGLWSRVKALTGAGGAVDPSRRLSAEAVLAIGINSLFQFGASMAGLFLNLYLWRLTEDLAINGVYNIIVFLLTPVGFLAGAWLAKRTDRLVTYRIGIVLTALFYLLVILAGTSVVRHFIWFALFNGFASGMYWTAYLVLMYDVSTGANRIRFLGLNTTFFNLAGLAGPAVAGTIIGVMEGLTGYLVTFSLALALFVLAAVFSLRIRPSETRHKAFYLKLVPLALRRQPAWLRALFAFFLWGVLQGITLFLPNIMLYRTVGREDWVGYLTIFFSGLVILSSFLISRFGREYLGRRYVLLSSVGVTVGAAFLFIDFTFWTVAVFMILFSLGNPLMHNTLSNSYYRQIALLPLKGQLRNEAVVMRETFLNAGRILSIVALLAFAGDLESAMLPVVLFAAAVVQALNFFLVEKPERQPEESR